MDKSFFKSKKAIGLLFGVGFGLVYLGMCFFKPEMINLQGFCSTIIGSVIAQNLGQAWHDVSKEKKEEPKPE